MDPLSAHLGVLVSASKTATRGSRSARDIDDVRRIRQAIESVRDDAAGHYGGASLYTSRLEAPEGVAASSAQRQTSIWDDIYSADQAEASSSQGQSSHGAILTATSRAEAKSSSISQAPPVLEELRRYAHGVANGDSALAESIVDSVKEILAKDASSDDEISAMLADSLGFEQLDLVSNLVGERRNVLAALSNCRNDAADSHSKQVNSHHQPQYASQKDDTHQLGVAPKPYIPGSSVVVHTKGEIEEAKRRKAELRKLRKLRGTHVGDANDEGDAELNAQEMAAIRAQSLRDAAERPLFTSDRVTTEGPKYPHVYTSGSGGNILSAFGSRFALPPGTSRLDHDFYEEVTIPPPKQLPMRATERQIPISEMDNLARGAFPGYKSLNRLQSAVYPLGYGSNENLLICAPTGAGKTDVAMLTVLRAIRQHAKTPEGVVGGIPNGKSGPTNTFGIGHDDFKIIYVAPMKALASEIVGKFSKRLRYLGVRVRELTGDMQMTRQEINETQMIVTTPEKWDVVTRKPTGEGELASKVKLLIIDEVHLLHEERGAVIETIVARTLRLVESSQSLIRIVGLSATLPNYIDVADFLRVNRYKGLFFFDSSFRPVPLEQHFLGAKGKVNSPIARQNMDKATFEKLQALVEQGHQIMIFVHARKETVKTAYAMRDMCREEGLLDLVTSARDQGNPEFFRRDIMESRNRELKELYETGFGIHHAGMLRKDRNLSERLFEKGVTRVLCCTSTLAWGVNLPAYAVLIKGTDIYDSSLGRFSDLSILDVLQIFGRAGRPQYESVGVGYIITSHDKLSHYVDAITSQHPIESKFKGGLIDALNAEVALGSVNSISDGITWLSYTYLFTRMRRNPLAYGMLADEVAEDPQLGAKRLNEIATAAKYLATCKMLEIDDSTSQLTITELGRIAARYYISYKTIEVFDEKLKSDMSEADLLGVFGHATDFAQIIPRETEIAELKALQVKVPCEIAHACDTSAGKANLLLQANVSRLRIDDFALVSDAGYVAQNAGRIMRALFEIALSKRWAVTAAALLGLTRSVERRTWPLEHPLGQSTLKADMIYAVSRWAASVSVQELAEMNSGDIAALCRVNVRHAEAIREAARRFPHLLISYTLRPLLHDVLCVDVCLEVGFEWDKASKDKGSSESFYVWLEDEDAMEIYQSRRIVLHANAEPATHLSFVLELPSIESMAGLQIRWISERWLGAEDSHFADFTGLVMPEPTQSTTTLLDLPLLATERCCQSLGTVSAFYADSFPTLNALQTQCFHAILHSRRSIILTAPNRSGRTTLAHMSIWRELQAQAEGSRPSAKTIVALYPSGNLARQACQDFKAAAQYAPDVSIKLALGAEDATGALDGTSAYVLFTTPLAIDSAVFCDHRRVSRTSLIIAEDLHLMQPIHELVLSSLFRQTAASQTRVIITTDTLESVDALQSWLKPRQCAVYSFSSKDRPTALKTTVVPFDLHYSSHLLQSMVKPAYDRLKASLHTNDAKAILFVPSQQQCFSTGRQLIRQAAADADAATFIGAQAMAYDYGSLTKTISDQSLLELLANGIGVITNRMLRKERRTMSTLFEAGAIRILIADKECCSTLHGLTSQVVIVMGAQALRLKEEKAVAEDMFGDRHATKSRLLKSSNLELVEYDSSTVTQMQAFARPSPSSATSADCFVFCQAEQAAHLRRVLDIGLLAESRLFDTADDAVAASRFRKDEAVLSWYALREMTLGRCRSRNDLMGLLDSTYARQRIEHNPCYYSAGGSSPREAVARLSEMVDAVTGRLEATRCVDFNGESSGPHSNIRKSSNGNALYGVEFAITHLGSIVSQRPALLGSLCVLSRQYATDADATAKVLLSATSFQVFALEGMAGKAFDAVLDATRQCIPSEILTRFSVPRPARTGATSKAEQPKEATPATDASGEAFATSTNGQDQDSKGTVDTDSKLSSKEAKALLLAVYFSSKCEVRTPSEAAALQSKNRKGVLNTSDVDAKEGSAARHKVRNIMFDLVASIIRT